MPYPSFEPNYYDVFAQKWSSKCSNLSMPWNLISMLSLYRGTVVFKQKWSLEGGHYSKV